MLELVIQWGNELFAHTVASTAAALEWMDLYPGEAHGRVWYTSPKHNRVSCVLQIGQTGSGMPAPIAYHSRPVR